jgi:hypothetical protein
VVFFEYLNNEIPESFGVLNDMPLILDDRKVIVISFCPVLLVKRVNEILYAVNIVAFPIDQAERTRNLIGATFHPLGIRGENVTYNIGDPQPDTIAKHTILTIGSSDNIFPNTSQWATQNLISNIIFEESNPDRYRLGDSHLESGAVMLNKQLHVR